MATDKVRLALETALGKADEFEDVMIVAVTKDKVAGPIWYASSEPKDVAIRTLGKAVVTVCTRYGLLGSGDGD